MPDSAEVQPGREYRKKPAKSPPERRVVLPSELALPFRVLYRIIANAVMAEEPTPTKTALRTVLGECGHPMSRDRLGEAVRRLDAVGLIQRKRIGSLLVYRLPGSDRHTKPCKDPEAKRREHRRVTPERPKAAGIPDWPRPTAESIAAYDAAMARRPFGLRPSRWCKFDWHPGWPLIMRPGVGFRWPERRLSGV